MSKTEFNTEKIFNTERVFEYFKEISAVPRGSGNMEKISSYCLSFAEKHSLRAVRDEANNVIIFKNGSGGCENSEPVILQGHLDMVCQKTENSDIDFESDGIEIYRDGDFLKARETTLGADNGIAVAMIMAILESDNLKHPPIEAVLTTDEEIGMIGAGKLNTDLLKGRKMINLDCEPADEVTVSCAGGSDFLLNIPIKRKTTEGTRVVLTVRGLKGGHSGVKINDGRVNSNLLIGRILNHMRSEAELEIISVNGGDKGNAIPCLTTAELAVKDADSFISSLLAYYNIVKEEISVREPQFELSAEKMSAGSFEVLDRDTRDKLLYMLSAVPNGVLEMSAEISGLVETSLNLGILATENDKVTMQFALRSNKRSALEALEERLKVIAEYNDCPCDAFGHYPPWEFKSDSELQRLYKEVYKERLGKEPKTAAIHAGLECGVFASKINGLDCIAVGPEMNGTHTVNEELSISSTEAIYEIIVRLLEKCV